MPNRSRTSIALQNLSRWATITNYEAYFLLPQEAKDAIEEYILSGKSHTDETVRLEKATEKDGVGTGVCEDIRFDVLVTALVSYKGD